MQQIISAFRKFRTSEAAGSGTWVLIGLVASQAIRLISNLILTRILVPEHFGIMAIVTTAIIVFVMLSDLGLNKSVINSPRVSEAVFRNTAWTLQILQGAFIGLLLAVSSYPMSKIYGEPVLFPMLLAVAFVTVIGGFRSISLTVYEKELRQRELVIVELASQILGTVCMIIIAMQTQSVWALLAGHVITSLAKVVASYSYLEGARNWFALEKNSVREIISFGKWIFISSMFGLVATQADVMIMGLYLSMDQLGKYAIAAIFARAIAMVIGQISTKVLHPFFRRLLDQDDFQNKLHRIRNRINFASIGICVFFAVFGDLIIQALYEERYRDAGWMLQFLALGKFGQCMSGTLRPYLFAKGDSFSCMLHQIFVTIVLIVGMVLGFKSYGPVGLILSYSFVPLLCHPVLIYQAAKHHFQCWRADLLMIGGGLLIVLGGWIILDSPTVDLLMKVYNDTHY